MASEGWSGLCRRRVAGNWHGCPGDGLTGRPPIAASRKGRLTIGPQVGNPMPLTLRHEAILIWLLLIGAPSHLAFSGKRAAARPDGSGVTRPMTASGKFALGNAAQHFLQLQGVFLFRASTLQIGKKRVDHILRP